MILTHYLDFSRLVALSQARFPSVVNFRLKDMRPTRVNFYLNEVLSHFTEALEVGALISVNEEGIRVRQLPVRK